jgi:hypothetical protein
MPDTEQVEMVEGDPAGTGDGYQWVVLANTTAAQFMSQLDGSIVIIALPAIFRGIGLDLPLPVHRDARCAVAHRLAGGPSLGGSMPTANSAAILTDAFPREKRGFALGMNQVSGLSGMFIGLVAGGLLATVDWRLVFWSTCTSGSSGPCGRTSGSVTSLAVDRAAGSTGGEMPPSPSASAPS